MKRKLLFITPHLSTGGQPQYLLQKIKSFINEFDIKDKIVSNFLDYQMINNIY